MLDKIPRPPIRITFEENYPFKDEFIERLNSTGMFALICPENEYFNKLCTLLLEDTDPSLLIIESCPDLPGLLSAAAHVVSTPSEGSWDFSPATPDDLFEENAQAILQKIKNNHFLVQEQTSGIKFFRKFMKADPLKKIELGDAFFYYENYTAAISQYRYATSVFPAYTARMIAWCLLLSSSPIPAVLASLDILIFTKNVPGVYYASKNADEPLRLASEYWLSSKDLPRRKRMLILYNCCAGFKKKNDARRVNHFSNELQLLFNTQKIEGSPFWERMSAKLSESQFFL